LDFLGRQLVPFSRSKALDADRKLAMTPSRINPTRRGKSFPEISESCKVIRFHPRGTPSRRDYLAPRWEGHAGSPDDDLLKYQAPTEDDNHHRMLVNGLAAAVLIVLIVIGRWMITTIVESQSDQDCSLADGSNCPPIYVPQFWVRHRN
jgi:hypothetical protein